MMKKSSRNFLSSGLAIVSLAAVLLISCETSEVYCYWANGPITVDGRLNDWKGTMAHWFEDENIVIGVANDSGNLYLSLRMNDQRLARIIARSGLTIWIDVNGGKDKEFELIFRDGPSGRGDDWRGGREEYNDNNDDDDTERRRPVREPSLHLKPSKDKPERQIDVDGMDGPKAAFDTSNGLFTWEFSIPLVKSGDSLFGIMSSPGSPISIGAKWGEIDRSAMRRMRGGGDGGFGGRGGGMGGGDGRGGRGGGGMGGRGDGERRQRPQKQELWIETTLALPGTEGNRSTD